MSPKKTTRRAGSASSSVGWTAEEKAAMKAYAQEKKAEARGIRDRAAGEKAALAAIAAMKEPDRSLARRVHEIVTASAPALAPKTWYGMPAYANSDGKVVCFFQSAQKFKTRYATFGFQDPAHLDEEQLRDTILIFALVVSETRLLLAYIEKKVMKGRDPSARLYHVYDSFVYCLPLELKKVVNTELTDISVTRQTESLRTRVENSHGILKDCFQQSVVQLAQALDPAIDGARIFPDFQARREQSVQLRDGLVASVRALREFQQKQDAAAAERMKTQVSEFYDHHIKYLMYRDWSGFELFYIEILKCASLPPLLQIAHRFETFLVTLLREVQKRALLQGTPAREDIQDILGS